ncbi:hypothetical protein MD484_g6301, partial [Candolleomyces efflorescens]
MVRFTSAATVTIAVFLATFVHADPASNVEGATADISARAEHAHTHSKAARHHHATRELKESEGPENLERDLSSDETALEARDDELEARFVKQIARILGRDFDDELEIRDFLDAEEEELSARGIMLPGRRRRYPIGYKGIMQKRELEDSELEARGIVHSGTGPKHKGLQTRELEDAELEARRLIFPRPTKRPTYRLPALQTRDLEDSELEARAIAHPSTKRYKGLQTRELEEAELEARLILPRPRKRPTFNSRFPALQTRDLEDSELDARAILRPWSGRRINVASLGSKALRLREFEDELEARGIMLPGRRYPVGYRGLRARELDDVELEARVAAPSLRSIIFRARPSLLKPPIGLRARETEDSLEARSLEELD